MKDEPNKEDLMVFVDETPSSTKKTDDNTENNFWRILITDDEQDVHSATTFALRNTKILGRRLEFLHAKSAKDTVEILKIHKDIAVIILDVVMETPNAGLDLVAVIRKQLNITDSRIILRTGQPNQAPEIEIIRDYDINDYKLKSELTQTKLYAALTTAVRSYKQIRMIEAGKQGLGLIVKSSADLLTQEGLNAFAHGVIVHIAGLMSVPTEGLICVHHSNCEKIEDSNIIAATGNYCRLIDKPLSELSEENVRESLASCLRTQSNVFGPCGVALYLGSDERGGMSCFISNSTNLDEIDAGLLELFCNNIRIFADNLSLLEKLKSYAYIDQLVGLPNKISLSEKINETLTGNQSQQYALATLLIDDFSEINISLGSKYGDSILLAVANRLRKFFPEPLFLARISRDSFAIFSKADQIQVDDLLKPFASHFNIDDQEQIISSTAVIRLFDKYAKSNADILQEMSIVLDSAKKQSRGKVTAFSNSNLEEAKLYFERLLSRRINRSGRSIYSPA